MFLFKGRKINNKHEKKKVLIDSTGLKLLMNGGHLKI